MKSHLQPAIMTKNEGTKHSNTYFSLTDTFLTVAVIDFDFH